MKKIILFIFISLPFATLIAVSGQTLSSPIILNAGEAKEFGGTTADSLIAADTLTYYFWIKSAVELDALLHLYYDETAGSQTTVIKVYGSNIADDKTFVELKKGKALSDWASASLTADANVFFDSQTDTVKFNRRLIKVQAISAGASSKGTLKGFAKTYKKY